MKYLSLLRRIIIGCFVVVVFFSYSGSFLRSDSGLRLRLMHILDQDIIFLKDGSVIFGWIWFEDAELIGIGESLFSLDDCLQIKRNALLQYIRGLI